MNKMSFRISSILLFFLLVIGLYLTHLYSYLLFHSLAEIFSIIIGFTLFIIAWNSRNYKHQSIDYLTFIGIAYLFVAGIDLLHMLSYKGMSIFTDYPYYANQLWIGARYMEALSLLVPLVFLRRKTIRPPYVVAGYAVVTAALVGSVFILKVFPVCYVEGVGQTPFKIVSEFIIMALLAIVAALLNRQRSRFAPIVHRKLLLSVIFTVVSELAFTFYLLNDDTINLLGHVFKIVSFYLIYEAIVITCITEPYETIFKELTEKEELLRRAALTDELTGLYNRHFLDLTSGDLLARADRYGEPMALAIVDLDHFKVINDTWGHPAGDEALRHVAGIMGRSIRAADILARIGGEEFAIIMPQTSLDGARTAAELVRNAIRNSPMPPPVSGLHTASVGIAERQPGESFRNWYGRADEALYRAKQNGRDRVETAAAQAETAAAIQEEPA